MNHRHLIKGALAVCFAGMAVVALIIGLQADARTLTDQFAVGLNPTPLSSYLFRFDPGSGKYYTLTLPTGSLPYGVAVTGTNPTHVWVAEFGLDKFRHLIYTNTNQVSWTDYPITSTAHSGPYRLAIDGKYVWFTERGANRIGRLDATTGQIVEFYGHGLAPNSGLADIKVAPNGWIWAAGQTSNRLIQLVVTLTTDYAFSEYTYPLLAGPFGVAIAPGINPSSYYVWFTAPESHMVWRLTPGGGSPLFVSIPNSRPYEIVSASDLVWFSDLRQDSIDQLQIGTSPIPNVYTGTGIVRPAGLAIAQPNVFWATLQNDQGGLARFVYTATDQTHIFTPYPLPTLGLRPTGIAIASDSGVWFGAFMPFKIFMPVVLRN